MALREIVHFGEDVLRKKSKEVTVFDQRLWVLLDDMYETLKNANGVGIAAPQIGILKRVVVIDIGEGKIELINPVIKSMKGKQRKAEGCLSYPGNYGYVSRPLKVKVTAQNRHGKFFDLNGEELLAIALCHELDHLNGVLFIDLCDEMIDNYDKNNKSK